MKVKVGDNIYDSNEVPVMIIMEQWEKDLIANMAVKATKFCSFPNEMSSKEVKIFMAEDGVSLSKPEIVLFEGEDWGGIYINGKLAVEGHHVRTSDLIEAMDLQVRHLTYDEAWIETYGSLPDKLSDVVLA